MSSSYEKENYRIVKELSDYYHELRNEMIQFEPVEFFKDTPIYEQYMRIGKILGQRK